MSVSVLLPALLAGLITAPQDPKPPATDASWLKELDRVVHNHPFFQKVDFSRNDAYPPLVFYLQKPPKDDREYVPRVVRGHVPFLLELLRVWEREYAQPLGLQRRDDMPVFGISVLSTAGFYTEYGRTVGDPSLDLSRAHYNHQWRLAVTYHDWFAQQDPSREERHALLHEFVHMLQHAYGTTGRMPDALWFNEGLADYRASCDHVASTLNDPPMRDQELGLVGAIHARAGLRWMVFGIEELLAATSYADVLKVAAGKLGGQPQPGHVLPAFYAQAALFVRFLHEGDAGRHRPAFHAFLHAVLTGKSGAEAANAAFGVPPARAELEQQYLAWLTGVLRKRMGGRYPDLAKAAGSGPAVGGAAPLPPPSPFDPAGLAWQDGDWRARIQAGRMRCAAGEYEAALAALPDRTDGMAREVVEALLRERERLVKLIEFRDELLDGLVQRKGVVTLVVGGSEVKGRLERRETGVVAVAGRNETAVPLRALSPDFLLREGQKAKAFEGAQRWLDPWIRYLRGTPIAGLRRFLEGEWSMLKDLRKDLTEELEEGRAAAALARWQTEALPEEPAAAAAALAQLREVLRMHGGSPLLQARRATIDQLARALAERAFQLDASGALGITGSVAAQDDGSMLVTYPNPARAPTADFAEVADAGGQGVIRIAYDGPTELRADGNGYRLIGNGRLRWAFPLAGRQEVQFKFRFQGQGDFVVELCRQDQGVLLVRPEGTITILDVDRNGVLRDEKGTPTQLHLEQVYTLRLVHDGSRQLEVFLDGKRTALLDVLGNRLGGELVFGVMSSSPIRITDLSIRGRIEPDDPLPLRDRFVEQALQGLWP